MKIPTVAILCLLSLVSGTDSSRSQEASSAISKLDMDKIQQEIMAKVTEELLKQHLSTQIETHVETKVHEELTKQEEQERLKELQKQEETQKQQEKEKIAKFNEFTDEDWRKYDQIVVYNKLQNVLQDLGNDKVLHSLWKDATAEDKEGPLRKFSVEFDLDSKQIGVSTRATDKDGQPLYQWKLDSDQGQIQHIKRLNPLEIGGSQSDYTTSTSGSISIANKKPVIPESQKTTEAVKSGEVTVVDTKSMSEPISEVETATIVGKDDATVLPPDADASGSEEGKMSSQEFQRDIAHKFILFFITFVGGIVGLVYIKFKMDKAAADKEAREKRAKGTFFEKVDNQTFFDYLADNMDAENYQVNPNARTMSPKFMI